MLCRLTHVSVVLALALCIVPIETRAQVTEVQPGARVRIRAPGIVAGRYAGTVLGRTADTVRVGAPGKTPLDIPFSRITSLEISRGDSRALGAVRGALWGGGIGLGSALIVGTSIEGKAVAASDTISTAQLVWETTIGGIFLGGIIGAIVGRERWESFNAPGRTSFRVQPRGIGATFGFTY